MRQLANPDTYKIHNRVEIPNSGGCYRGKIHKNGVEMYSGNPDGKIFFPDTWDELRVIDEIKVAWGNKVDKQDSWGSGKYLGYTSPPENIPVEIKIVNGKIKTAWARWNP